MKGKDLRLVNTPNNIAKGSIEIDAQINRLYYNILNNIQRDNKDLIIKTKKGESLTEVQKSSLKKLDSIEVVSCKISNEEIVDIFKNNNYKTEVKIDERFTSLQKAIFKFTTGESNISVQLVGRVEQNNDGYIVNLDAKLYKYLFYNLDVGFTPVNLATLFNLQGQYAQILYIALRAWTGTKKEIEFTIDELREMMKTGEKYPAYRNFKQRVIMQAVSEINKSGSMSIDETDMPEKKNGRSVSFITFKVEDLEPRVMPSKEKADLTNKLSIKKKPIEWVEGIMVSDVRILNALNAMYGDIKHGLARNTIRQAYVEFLKSDKYSKSIIDNTGLPYYMSILDRMLTDHREQTLRTGAYEVSTEFEMYSEEPESGEH